MRAISEEIHTNFIHNKCSRFIAKLFPHLPGANELRSPRVMEVSRIPCDTCATVQRWRGIPHGGNDGYENTQQHSWSFHKIFIPGFNLISIVQQQQKQRQQQQQKLCYVTFKSSHWAKEVQVSAAFSNFYTLALRFEENDVSENLWNFFCHIASSCGSGYLTYNFNILSQFSNKLFTECPLGIVGPPRVNSSPPNAAYATLVQIMDCRLFGAKPLFIPMLGHCQLDP